MAAYTITQRPIETYNVPTIWV